MKKLGLISLLCLLFSSHLFALEIECGTFLATDRNAIATGCFYAEELGFCLGGVQFSIENESGKACLEIQQKSLLGGWESCLNYNVKDITKVLDLNAPRSIIAAVPVSNGSIETELIMTQGNEEDITMVVRFIKEGVRFVSQCRVIDN